MSNTRETHIPRASEVLSGCFGKVSFENRMQAQSVLARRKSKGKFDQKVYGCKTCGKFHIGSNGGR